MADTKASGERDLPETTRREIKTRVADLLAAIKELRPDKDMSVTAVGERLGVGKSAVSNWSNMANSTAPSLATLIRICKEYSATLDYLVFGDQESRMSDQTMNAIRRAQATRLAAMKKEPSSDQRRRKVG